MVQMSKVRICKGCQTEIVSIKTGATLGRITCEAEPIWVKQSQDGDFFYTIDGMAVKGFPAGDADDDPDSNLIVAYMPHLGRCPNNGRRPRNRQRRPSGYR